MNENFMIPDVSSLYNIQSIYNRFIEEYTKSGFENLLINPSFKEVVRDETGTLKKVGWEYDDNESVVINSNVVVFDDSSDSIRQYIAPQHLSNDVYTLVLDIENNEEFMVKVNGESFAPYVFTPAVTDLVTNSASEGLERTIAPLTNEFGNPIRQQIAYSFRISGIQDQPLHISFYRKSGWGGVDSIVEFHNVSLVKGMFGLNLQKKESFFTDYVKYNEAGYYEVSMDGGYSYHRILTDQNEDIEHISNLLAAGDFFYTKQEVDVQFLRKDIPDAASQLITFLEGIRSEDDVNLSAASKLLLDGGSLVVNNSQQVGTGQPTRNFSLTVKRADAADAVIRYNEGIDMWEFNHGDGQWRILGSAQGTGSGTGSSELEYYAEILNNSGYRWAYYDLFDENDEDESVLNYSDNLTWDGDNTNYFVASGATGPFILTSKNIWNPDHAGNQYTLFIHCLTNQVDMTSGINISYALDGAGGGEPWSPSDPAWIDVQQNEFITPSSDINEFYLKFEITDPAVVFHSFGVFYGVWSATYSTYTRLREYYTVPSDQAAGAQITVPNGGYYSIGEKALEVYLNRVRLIEGIDYIEVNNSTIQLSNAINVDDVIEFYEKYGYADFSNDNQVLIQNHIDDTNGHGIEVGVNQTWNDVSGSRVFDTAYQNTDGKPIMVAISGDVNLHLEISTDNITYLDFHSVSPVIIPDGHYYKVTDLGGGTLTAWYELR